MKYVLGMAKSPLDARGAKARNLELDFLRLLLAVTRYRKDGRAAQGYLLVLQPALAKRVEAWKEKYAAGDAVRVLKGALSPREAATLATEKAACAQGMKSGHARGGNNTRSVADHGKKLGERRLEEHILALEPGVKKSSEPNPLGVRWDYFGERDDTKRPR